MEDQLTDEIADTALYLDLLAARAGIDLGAAIVRKFNRVSEKHGFPERLTIDHASDEKFRDTADGAFGVTPRSTRLADEEE